MFAYIIHWFKGSIARAIFLALIVLSVLPIIVVSVLLTRQSTTALTSQMEANLSQLARARAEEINLHLQEVGRTTEIAAHQATELLQRLSGEGA